MAESYNVKERALALANKTDSNSISPKEVGTLMYDMASYAEGVSRNGGTLGIRQVYSSVAEMEADTKLVDVWGNPLKKGNLVVIYDGTTEGVDNNKIYAFLDPGWKLSTELPAGYATKEEVTELASQVGDRNFFTGKGNVFSSVQLNGFKPNTQYTIYPAKVWDDVAGGAGYKFQISAYKDGVGSALAGTAIGNDIPEYYSFTTPSDFDYIQVGGRAISGEKVFFYISETEIYTYVDGKNKQFSGTVGSTHSSLNHQVLVNALEGDDLYINLTSNVPNSISKIYQLYVFYTDGTNQYYALYSNELSKITAIKDIGAVGVSYGGNFVLKSCQLTLSVIHQSTLVKGLFDKAEEINTLSLISTANMLPNIDTNKKIIDFGQDPVLLLGDEYYVLSQMQTNSSKYREVTYYDTSNSSGAIKILFDKEKIEFRAKVYSYKPTSDEILIGSLRLKANTFEYISANFPFAYTINGTSNSTYDCINSLDSFDYYRTSNRYRCYKEITTDYLRISVTNIPTGYRYAINVGSYNSAGQIIEGYDSSWLANVGNFDLSSYAKKATYVALLFSKTDGSDITDDDINIIKSSFTFNIEYNALYKVKAKYPSTLKCKTNIECVAHRGIHVNGIPENSLDSYRYAGYCGFKYAEADFCPTLDGELVLMHDASINRTMYNKANYTPLEETVNVADKTLAELRDNYVFISSDSRMRRPIPTLEEFFITCRSSGIFPIAEIKTNGTTNEHVLKAYELGKKIMGEGNFGFTSFALEKLDYVRSLSEKTLLLYLSAGLVDTVNTVTGKLRESDNTWWLANYETLTKDLVYQHKNRGIKVGVWNVTAKCFDDAIKIGADFIVGDTLSANIDGLSGIAATSNFGFSDFDTDGKIENETLKLEAGQSVSFIAEAMWLGGYYISVIGKGNFTISGRNLTATVDSDVTDRYVYQVLVDDNSAKFTITAESSTEIEFLEFLSAKLCP